MAGLITVAELLARPDFDGLDHSVAQAMIDDASALVRLEAAGRLDDVVSPDAPPAVIPVLASMIRRGVRNPLGNNQETLGDYSRSVGQTSGGGVATLYLTKREKKIVRQAVGLSAVASIDLQTTLPEQRSDCYYGTGGDWEITQ